MGVLEEKYNEAMANPLRVLEIFNEFFGEDRVDMQGFPTFAEVQSALPETSNLTQVRNFINNAIADNRGFILVHFPFVRITNEFDKFTDARHIFAKVIFDIHGRIKGKFLLNRSEYTMLHFSNNYMHSHISCIPINNFELFQSPCTGNGPINNTICSLAKDFDEDLWRLFCLELDKYVQVESLSGGPYHRLESLVVGGRTNSYVVFTEIRVINNPTSALRQSGRASRNAGLTYAQLAEFTKYVIDSNILKFSYQNGCYGLAMSPTEYYIKLSNLFIKWYNKKYKKGEVHQTLDGLFSYGIIDHYKFVDGRIVKEYDYGRTNYRNYIGRKVCTFKGHDILLNISDFVEGNDQENNDIIILRQELAEYIFTKIFNVLNFRYGNNKQQSGDTSDKKVYYL